MYKYLGLGKLFLFLFEIFFSLTFFGTTAVVVILGFVNMFIIWPCNRRLYRRLINYIYWLTISHVVFLCQWWSSIKLIMYVDTDIYNNYFGKEHAVCLMNHRYEIDYLSLVVLSDKFGVSGNLKACIKDTVKYVPIVGWCLYLVEYVFLTRSFINDENTIKNQIHEIADNPLPVWLIFYPEGTRITSHRHYQSRLFEKERGLRPLRYHLQPRTKGFLAGIPAVKSRFAAIYDTELYIEDCGGNVNFLNLFSCKSYIAHMHIRRIPVNDLPSNENEQKQYLFDVFQKKDEIMHNFLNKRYNFNMSDGTKIQHPIQFGRNPIVLFNFIIWCTICCYPLLHTLIMSIVSSDLTSFLTSITTYLVAFTLRTLLFWTIKLKTHSFKCCEHCDKMS